MKGGGIDDERFLQGSGRSGRGTARDGQSSRNYSRALRRLVSELIVPTMTRQTIQVLAAAVCVEPGDLPSKEENLEGGITPTSKENSEGDNDK
jgi:hypothetical protein